MFESGDGCVGDQRGPQPLDHRFGVVLRRGQAARQREAQHKRRCSGLCGRRGGSAGRPGVTPGLCPTSWTKPSKGTRRSSPRS